MIKKSIIGLFLFPIFLFSQSGVTVTDSIFSGGKYRTYKLYIPANYTGTLSVPLILNLHGYTSNASQQQTYSNFMPIADTAGFLMVYPQGVQDSYGNPFWNAGTVATSIVNDTLFLNQLIDFLKLTYNINLSKVYVTGLSNGGFMSHYMACFCNRKITAIASVAGTFFNFWTNCSPGKIVPVMHIHGTADPTVPYNGNANMLGADSTVKRWVTKNACTPTPNYSMVPNTNISDGSTAEHYQYFISGNSKSIVEFYKINNGAHTWPGSPYIIGTTNQDINASAEIWRFFRQFSSNDFSTKVNAIGQSEYVKIFPNPFNEFLNIQYFENIRSVDITDLCGKQVISLKINESVESVQINMNLLEKGIYFVCINYSRKFKIIKN
ncbi:MAG: T9SS type A sorting domain-containing protein [Bacteroidia bacterium]|nr:T9SS type A sorting domain-containing protein [Bacteroidia bacterium]